MELCKNNPEFISKLADRIIKGENIGFYPMRGLGKSTYDFNMNLIKEIYERIINEQTK